MKTEKEMREAEVPTFDSSRKLRAYIDGLVERDHDYGTCVYAMSMAATAAFNYVARKLGVTGFQASCADMDIVRRVRHMRGPFMIVNGADALYPQYDLHAKLGEFLDEIKPWLAEEAAKSLASESSVSAHPNVVAHWKQLAEFAPPAKEGER